jgi:hypothetical protein
VLSDIGVPAECSGAEAAPMTFATVARRDPAARFVPCRRAIVAAPRREIVHVKMQASQPAITIRVRGTADALARFSARFALVRAELFAAQAAERDDDLRDMPAIEGDCRQS